MPAPQPLLQAVKKEFGVELTPDEATSLHSFLELHRALLERMEVSGPGAAMAVWQRLVSVTRRTLSPRYIVDQEPALPFEYYNQALPDGQDWVSSYRHQLAEVFASYMRGEMDATIVGDQMMLVWEMGDPTLNAVTTELSEVVDPYGRDPMPVSPERWEWLRRLVVALLSDLPLEIRKYPGYTWDTRPADVACEPFGTAAEWEQQEGLLEQLRLPATIPAHIPTGEARAAASRSRVGFATWITVLVLLACLLPAGVTIGSTAAAVIGILPFAILVLLVAHRMRRQPAPEPPTYTAIMVARDVGAATEAEPPE